MLERMRREGAGDARRAAERCVYLQLSGSGGPARTRSADVRLDVPGKKKG